MPTDAWPLDTPMLPPLVLRPPHGPRLVRLLVVILAAMFHLATAGWSLITNGGEGELARAAQDLWERGGWLAAPGTAGLDGPLMLWMTRLSFALFGVSEFAARFPTALGAVAAVWFTLRLAERYGGIWRGFVAALILICSPGMFTMGRALSPFPITAALIAAGFYSLQCGWAAHPAPVRRRRFLLAWIAWSGSALAGGWTAACLMPLGVLLLACGFREARMRFRGFVSWEGGVILAGTLLVMTATGFPPGMWPAGPRPEVSQIASWQMALLFPWSLLLLPAAWKTISRLARLQPLEWNEAFPLAWLTSGLILTAALPSFFFPILWWPAFAVWASLQMATLHRKSFLRWNAVVLLAAVGAIFIIVRLRELLPGAFPHKAVIFAAIPDFFWFAVSPIAFIALIAFLLFAAAAFCAEWMQSRRFALLAYFAAMIPAGFAFADIGAKFAPYFSDAGIAQCLHSETVSMPLYSDLEPAEISSLAFYLPSEIKVHKAGPDRWTPPFLLVTGRERFPYWKAHLPGAVRVECTESEHLLLSVRAGEAR